MKGLARVNLAQLLVAVPQHFGTMRNFVLKS
jgi:hypothetical protein